MQFDGAGNKATQASPVGVPQAWSLDPNPNPNPNTVPLRVGAAAHAVGRVARGAARLAALAPRGDQVARRAGAMRVVAALPRPHEGVPHAAAVVARLAQLRLVRR